MQDVPAYLLDIAGESILSVRDGDEVTSWNLAASTLYGWRPDEALGRPLEDLVGPYPAEARRAVMESGTWKGRVARRTRDGSTREVRLLIARDASPSAHGDWVEFSSSVDPEHPAERALAESEYRYRNLFGAAVASFWELDFSGVGAILRQLRSDGVEDIAIHLERHPDIVRTMMRATRIVDTNDRSIELFGLATRQELMSTPIDRHWPEESTQTFAKSVVAAISGAPRFVAETRLRRLDGREFDALFTVSFLPGTVGQGTLLIGVTDISDRVRATRELGEASMRQKMYLDVPSIALSEMSAPELVPAFARLREEGVKDLGPYIDRHPEFIPFAIGALRFENVNDAALHLFRASSREELVGRTLTGIFKPGCPALRRSLEGSFLGEPVFQADMRIDRLDGTPVDTFFCRVSNPVPDRAKFLVAQIDITEQVQARDELERMRQQVAHSSRVSLLGQLSASIAHEISRPIAELTGHAAAAEQLASRLSNAPPQLLDATSRIAQQATRAGAIIQRIRSMAADRRIDLVPLSIEEVVAETRMLLRQELSDNGVTVTQNRPVRIPSVLGDRIQLQQILANLMMNAMQAMEGVPHEGRSLEIAIAHDGTAVRVDVADRGSGLSEELRARPFQDFRTTKPDGLGLGLTICRSIAEAHGGVIEMSNRSPGPGAVFTLILPAATA